MNVLYHHRTRGRGAEGVHIMGIVDAFRLLGHKVSLLSLPGSDPDADTTATKEAVPANAPPRSLPLKIVYQLTELTKYIPEFVFELVEVAYNLVAVFRLRRAFNSESPDLLYERYSLFMFAGVWLARQRGVPVVLEVNDAAIVERVRPLFFSRMARAIERWIFCHCDGLVFISTHFQQAVLQSYGENIAPSVVCPNAANIDQFNLEGVDRNIAKQQLGLDGKVVCGYVGAFVYWHGIDWFVKEIAPQLAQFPDLVLLLVGDGVVFEEIQQIVVDNKLQGQVFLPGRVNHSAVADYIAAMDYGILPDSNHYGSPMKLFEMMAMGVALVSPSFEPIAEVVEDNQHGWLFPPKDKAAAVKQVLRLSEDLAHIQLVGQQAADYIRAERQWTHNVQKILGLIP